MSKIALRALASGHVQGVGFRAHTRRAALERGLTGSAMNLPDGRVEVHAEGDRDACEGLLTWLQGPDTPGSVDEVAVEWVAATGASGFTVR